MITELPPDLDDDDDGLDDDDGWEDLDDDTPHDGVDEGLFEEEEEDEAEGDDPFDQPLTEDEDSELEALTNAALDAEEEKAEGDEDLFAPLEDEDEWPEGEGAAPELQRAHGGALGAFVARVASGVSMDELPTLAGRRVFDAVRFRPTSLFSTPPDEVSTAAVIGPAAPRPLHLGVPIWLRLPPSSGGVRHWKALALGAAQVGAALCLPQREGICVEAEGRVVSLAPGDAMPQEAVARQAAAFELWLPPAGASGPDGAVGGEGVIPLISSQGVLERTLAALRALGGGVPCGVRLMAGDLESDLPDVLGAAPDFITIVGRGGAGAYPVSAARQDALLPLPHALTRARRVMEGLGAQVSLVASGGVFLPRDIAIALALGADAVELAALPRMALVGAAADTSDGGARVEALVTTYIEEVRAYARQRGWGDVGELRPEDLASPFGEVAAALRIRVMQG